jgi:hypothetical protein
MNTTSASSSAGRSSTVDTSELLSTSFMDALLSSNDEPAVTKEATTVNAMKQSVVHEYNTGCSAPPAKKAKVAISNDCKLNYDPDSAAALDGNVLAAAKQQMLNIMSLDEAHQDVETLKSLLKQTFVNRRQLINSKASVLDVRQQYAALFTIDRLTADYAELTTQPSHRFMSTVCRNLIVCAGSIMRLTEKMSTRKTKIAKQFSCEY